MRSFLSTCPLPATDTPDSRSPRVIPQGAQDQAGELGPQADHRRLVPRVGELFCDYSYRHVKKGKDRLRELAPAARAGITQPSIRLC